jgi:Xaa-Pro aminopeptidase
VDHELRRSRVVERLDALEVDGLFVTRLPNVRYLTGFTGSNAQALITRERTVFYTDGRYDEQSRHEVTAADRVIYLEGFPPLEADVAAGARLGFEAAGVTYRYWERLTDRLEDRTLVPVGAEVERLRTTKDPDEVARIAAAQETADVAFERVVLGGGLHEGLTEHDLALALETSMRTAGADEKGFPTIAAFGENAAEPHHDPGERELRRGDVVKLDFGARVDGYHSDMTRTVAFGDPGEELREIREVVAAGQRAGIEAVKPGATLREVDAAARDAITSAGRGEWFPHGLGHGVGLEIHEAPLLHWTADDVLQQGSVVTIEPGVYVPGLGGVRIEDMVEVTADGAREIPRSTKELVVL